MSNPRLKRFRPKKPDLADRIFVPLDVPPGAPDEPVRDAVKAEEDEEAPAPRCRRRQPRAR